LSKDPYNSGCCCFLISIKMKKIYKVAGIAFRDNAFFMVRKAGKDIWTNLGGKREKGENDEQALRREVKEEIDCDVEIISRIGEFENKAALDDAIVHICAYQVELIGQPKISDDELEEFGWIDSNWQANGIKLPLSITEQIIPYCIKNKLLNW